MAPGLLKRFGKTRIIRVLTAWPIRIQNEFGFPIIHVLLPFCPIQRQRLYSRERPLLRAASDVTALYRVTIATSLCQSAPLARRRFPDTKIVRGKKARAVRET